jgi:hypothetical protein
VKREILELGLALGCSVRQVQQWKSRGHVRHRRRLPMLREAAARLVPLADADIAWGPPAMRRVGCWAKKGRSAKAASSRRRKGQAPAGVKP